MSRIIVSRLQLSGDLIDALGDTEADPLKQLGLKGATGLKDISRADLLCADELQQLAQQGF